MNTTLVCFILAPLATLSSMASHSGLCFCIDIAIQVDFRQRVRPSILAPCIETQLYDKFSSFKMRLNALKNQTNKQMHILVKSFTLYKTMVKTNEIQ